MVAAGIRTLAVNGAAACGALQVQAIATGMLREREDAIARVDVLHHTGFHQSLADVFKWFARFKLIH